jgi:putative transposase
MPRYARLHAPGALHHVIARFVDRRFRIRGAAERREYLRRLGEAVRRSDWRLLAYAVMSNHVHLVATAGELPVGRLTRRIHTGFAAWLNAREHGLGPVFATRPTVVVMAPSAALRVIAYVHNNPVRAGVETDPAASRWTSHRFYMALDPAPGWLDVEEGLRCTGYDALQSGRAAFHRAVAARRGDPRDPVLSGGDPVRARRAVRAACGASVELSSPEVDPLESGGVLHRMRAVSGAALRHRWEGESQDLVARVAAATAVELRAMRGPGRSRAVVRARRLALLAGFHFLGRTLTEIAGALGLSVPAASQLLNRGAPHTDSLVREAFAIAEQCRKATT